MPERANMMRGGGMVMAPAEIDLRAIFGILWRRKFVLLAVVNLITMPLILYVLLSTPRYTAKAVLMIDTRPLQMGIDEVKASLPVDAAMIGTQLEIMQSEPLAARVIKTLNLDQDPEFNLALRESGEEEPSPNYLSYLDHPNPLGNILSAWLRTARDALGSKSVMGVFLSKLRVGPVSDSHVIAIEYTSERPEKAVLIANTIAELYLLEQLEVKREAIRRASVQLDDRLAKLRVKVLDAEDAVQAFKAKLGGYTGQTKDGVVDVLAQQLSEINSQLVMARADRMTTEARLLQIKNLLEEPGGVESAAEVLNSPLIRSLRQQEAELFQRQQELKAPFGGGSFEQQRLKAQLSALHATIKQEVDKIVRALEGEVVIARAREKSLDDSLAELKRNENDLTIQQVRLRELERVAEASRALYQTMLLRFAETSEQTDLQVPDGRLIAEASVPNILAHPKPIPFVAVGFVGSIMLGALIAFLLEKGQTSLRDREETEAITGVPVLGMVPSVEEVARSCSRGRFAAHEARDSRFREAIRTIHAAVALRMLSLSRTGTPGKMILITSSVPEEGKTVLATSLAQQAASSGKHVLLIDCDIRRGLLHKLMGVPNEVGFVNLLQGKPFDSVAHRDELSGMHFITSGNLLSAGASKDAAQRTKDACVALFGADHAHQLLNALAAQYDLVLIDAPPSMIAADARLLASWADQTIFVVRWGWTRRSVVLASLKQLASDGAHLTGIVMTRVNMRKYVRSGFTDSQIYTSKYNAYY